MKKIICFILLLAVINQIYTSDNKKRRIEAPDCQERSLNVERAAQSIQAIGRSCSYLVITENSPGHMVNKKRLEHKNLIMENIKKALLLRVPPSEICRYANTVCDDIKYLKYILATEHFTPPSTYNESYSIKGLESNIDVFREWKRNNKPKEGREQAKTCIANIIKQVRILKHNGSKAYTSLNKDQREFLKSVIYGHIAIFKLK